MAHWSGWLSRFQLSLKSPMLTLSWWCDTAEGAYNTYMGSRAIFMQKDRATQAKGTGELTSVGLSGSCQIHVILFCIKSLAS